MKVVKKKKSVKKSNNSFNRNLVIGVVVLVAVFLLLVNFTGYSEEEGLATVGIDDFFENMFGEIEFEEFDTQEDFNFEDESNDESFLEGMFVFLNDEPGEQPCVEEGFGILPGFDECCEGLEPNDVFICYPSEEGGCSPACSDDEVCVAGICTSSEGSCSGDSDCFAGEYCCVDEDDSCEIGYCNFLKTVGEDCSSNPQCFSGNCKPYPAQVLPNPDATYVCKTCGNNNDCSPDEVCAQDYFDCVQCSQSSPCKGSYAGAVCDIATGSCVPCTTDQECQDQLLGNTCVFGGCQ